MDLNRRDFGRLTMAALSGAMAGAALTGCGGGEQPPPAAGAGGTEQGTGGAGTATSETVAAADVHACRGLNACKGKGKGGANACAGQGECATTAAHTCAGMNECKNLGGCGEAPGANACKGQGGCEVPLHEGAWEKAREAFEKRMAAAGKQVGTAPPRKE
jgi:hypothetical protein